MNLEQLQAMTDEELNELSAVKVMEWEKSFTFEGQRYNGEYGKEAIQRDWNPTTDMNDAMELWNKLHSEGWELSISCDQKVTYPWDCRMFMNDGFNKEKRVIAHEKTASRAITIASILAKE